MVMEVIFICLAMIVIVFLLSISLTLFKIEKAAKLSLIIAERKIVKVFGKR